jgi:hypothetical protein
MQRWLYRKTKKINEFNPTTIEQVSKVSIDEEVDIIGLDPGRKYVIEVIIADQPSRKATRIIRGKQLRIPSSIENPGPEALPVLVQIWKLKQEVIETQVAINDAVMVYIINKDIIILFKV